MEVGAERELTIQILFGDLGKEMTQAWQKSYGSYMTL